MEIFILTPENEKFRFLEHAKKEFNKNWGARKASIERPSSAVIHVYLVF